MQISTISWIVICFIGFKSLTYLDTTKLCYEQITLAKKCQIPKATISLVFCNLSNRLVLTSFHDSSFWNKITSWIITNFDVWILFWLKILLWDCTFIDFTYLKSIIQSLSIWLEILDILIFHVSLFSNSCVIKLKIDISFPPNAAKVWVVWSSFHSSYGCLKLYPHSFSLTKPWIEDDDWKISFLQT